MNLIHWMIYRQPEITPWLSALAPAIGFVGVILTLWINEKFRRQASANEWRIRRQEARDASEHEANGLRSALLVEIAQIWSFARAHIVAFEGKEKDLAGKFQMMPMKRHFPIYEANINKISLLAIDEIGAISICYTTCEETTRMLSLFQANNEIRSDVVVNLHTGIAAAFIDRWREERRLAWIAAETLGQKHTELVSRLRPDRSRDKLDVFPINDA